MFYRRLPRPYQAEAPQADFGQESQMERTFPFDTIPHRTLYIHGLLDSTLVFPLAPNEPRSKS